MNIKLYQKAYSDQEVYNFIADFLTEEEALEHIKSNSLEGIFITTIGLHKYTTQNQTVTDLVVVTSQV